MKVGVRALVLVTSLMLSSITFSEVPVEDISSPSQDGIPTTFAEGTNDTPSAMDDTIAQEEKAESPAVTVAGTESENTATAVQEYHQQPDTQLSQQQAVAGLSLEQRIARMEQQLANMQQSGAFTEVNNLQQQLQAMQGRLDEESHKVQVLQNQQRDLFQDVDARLEKVSAQKNYPEANLTAVKKDKEIEKTTRRAAAKDATTDAIVDGLQPGGDTGPIGQDQNLKKEQNVYENAFNHIKSKQYAQASNAMQSYLATYPEGKYAANATYWLGELYLLNGENDKASKQFSRVINDYPEDSKAPNALLKLGYISYDKGKWEQARSNFKKVVKGFPNTPSSRLASQRLTQMADQGH